MRLELRGLRVVASIGVLPEERERPQPLEVDLDVDVDDEAAVDSDELGDAVDYGALAATVGQAFRDGHLDLLERAAGVVADAVLAVDGRISAVEVVVRKLRPPVPEDLATAGVRLRRSR